MAGDAKKLQPIIVKKVKKGGHGAHGEPGQQPRIHPGQVVSPPRRVHAKKEAKRSGPGRHRGRWRNLRQLAGELDVDLVRLDHAELCTGLFLDHLQPLLQVADFGSELFVAGRGLGIRFLLHPQFTAQRGHARHATLAEPQLGMHHGQDTSSPESLVHGVRPRVAVVNNGTRKGALPLVMRTLYTSPGFEDVWQLHVSLLTGQEYTAPGLFIANDTDEPTTAIPVVAIPAPAPGAAAPPPPAHNGQAYWVKVSAQDDGTFAVTNQRNGFFKTYASRAR